MSRTVTTRMMFQLEIRAALDVAEANLREKFFDQEIELSILKHQMVSKVVAPWMPILNWDYARVRAAVNHRSCFVSIRTCASPDVAVLALIAVSKHRAATSLLFLEKAEFLMPPKQTMVMMNLVLETVGAAFESASIIIDTPDPELVPYYKSFGYRAEKRLGGRLLLTKPAA